ncbi:MAG: hypothetical protein GY816_09870 [Cytophagales bacterium]|nr:hypothetical protein [Cytophagales bacterium]
MRAHDIVILMKMISLADKPWYKKDLSYQLVISASEITESLNRSRIARLVNSEKTRVNTHAFMEFVSGGLSYVFPAEPGRITIGIPTAHSAAPLEQHIHSQDGYVWPYAHGRMRGEAIAPLHPKVPEAVQNDLALYELLALADAIRVGRIREKKLAVDLLNERVNAY